MTKPLRGQISLFDTDDHDDAQNATGARYGPQRGIVGHAGAHWRGYSPDTDEDTARVLFRMRFGHDPAEVRRVAGALLAGPV